MTLFLKNTTKAYRMKMWNAGIHVVKTVDHVHFVEVVHVVGEAKTRVWDVAEIMAAMETTVA